MLRARYDEAFARGDRRPASVMPEAVTGSMAPKPPERHRNPGARPFVLRAEELFRKGDPKQAKIQLTLAIHMDKDNAALDAFLKEIEAEIVRRAAEEKKKWQRNQ
jgi:hypothetical protein